MSIKKPSILFDMDGTTFDFPEKLAARIAADNSFPKSFRLQMQDVNNRTRYNIRTLFEDPTQHLKLKKMIQNIYQTQAFFASLEPYAWVVNTIKALQERYDVWFCTSPSEKACGSESEKTKAILHYFWEEFRDDININRDKTKVRCNLLIDDTPTVIKWRYTPEREFLLMNRASNQHIIWVPRLFLDKQEERWIVIADVLVNKNK